MFCSNSTRPKNGICDSPGMAIGSSTGAELYRSEAGWTSWSNRKPVTPTASRLSTTPSTTWLTR